MTVIGIGSSKRFVTLTSSFEIEERQISERLGVGMRARRVSGKVALALRRMQ